MNNSQKILKMISGFIEAGVLSSQDLKKELLTSIKFNKENLVNKLDLVTRDEFAILKKIIVKQQKEINLLKKNKKAKKAKKS
tara:strand:- start:2428 stop:2673 length:246 start_codon:yes stop_codon:yes gene_type:complete